MYAAVINCVNFCASETEEFLALFSFLQDTNDGLSQKNCKGCLMKVVKKSISAIMTSSVAGNNLSRLEHSS